MEWGPDRWRLYRLALGEAGRSLLSAVRRFALPTRLGAPKPSRLVLAPQDLRTADPTVASDIYAGYFVFKGRAVETAGRSPFDFPAPSPAWGEALYGFGWLRHLRAADTALARANARSLVDDFITRDRALRPGPGISQARQVMIASRRLISYLSQSPLLLEGADHAFYGRLLESIGSTVRILERRGLASRRPQRRLPAAMALCYAGLCCEGFERLLRRAGPALARELDAQVLPDGGHVSRNPRALVELLLDLLPLRQLYASRGIEPPDGLVRAVDRMIPMLRLFRFPDGSLARVNGMGLTATDHLATILVYDEARSAAILHAPHSGYERLEARGTVVVADVGKPPPWRWSPEAHAGALSFELASGPRAVVVNCGSPRSIVERVRASARATAAHSTATVGEVSSCRFLQEGGGFLDRRISRWFLKRVGPVVLTSPGEARAEREEGPDGVQVTARHDGYRSRFGVTHQRRLRLSPDGERLDGEDVFLTDAGAQGADATLRFHLAPGIRASRVQEGRVIHLVLPGGEAWQFEVTGGDARLEESVFFAATDGARRTEQIVVPVRVREGSEPARPTVAWRFERLHGPETGPPRRPG